MVEKLKFVCIMIFLLCFSIEVKAEESVVVEWEDYYNPHYPQLEQILDEISEVSNDVPILYMYVVPQFDVKEELADFISENLISREAEISFQYRTSEQDIKTELRKIWDLAMSRNEDSDPRSGDYLRYQFAGYKLKVSYSQTVDEQGRYCYNAVYSVAYFTNAEQEKVVDRKCLSILNELQMECKTEVQKIKKIYDFVCNNVEYDNWNYSEQISQYTAYGALTEGKAVCQGYALLVYRLCKEANIQAKIIAGIANGEAHVWNIVKIGDKYYNIDSTWDATFCAANKAYKYFLKSDNDFKGHIREERYRAEGFLGQYPMAVCSYEEDEEIPGKVEYLSVTRSDLPKCLKVGWQELKDVAGYELYKREAYTKEYILEAKIAADVTEYIDRNVSVGKIYYYRIRAYNEERDGKEKYGDFSDVKGAKVIMRPPRFHVKGFFGGKKVTFYGEQENVKIYYSKVGDTITKEDICLKSGDSVEFSSYSGYIYAKAYDEDTGVWSPVARLILDIPTVDEPEVVREGDYACVECNTPGSYLVYTIDGSLPTLTNGVRVLENQYKIHLTTDRKIRVLGIRSCFSNSNVLEVN